MRLAEYLKDRKLSDGKFAEKIGKSRQTVHRYKNGERFPEKDALNKIFEVTGGAVTANDFTGIAAKASRGGHA